MSEADDQIDRYLDRMLREPYRIHGSVTGRMTSRHTEIEMPTALQTFMATFGVTEQQLSEMLGMPANQIQKRDLDRIDLSKLKVQADLTIEEIVKIDPRIQDILDEAIKLRSFPDRDYVNRKLADMLMVVFDEATIHPKLTTPDVTITVVREVRGRCGCMAGR